MGAFFNEYIIGGREYSSIASSPIVSLDTNDLRDIIKAAYEAGKNNAASSDAMIHVDAITSILAMVEAMTK